MSILESSCYYPFLSPPPELQIALRAPLENFIQLPKAELCVWTQAWIKRCAYQVDWKESSCRSRERCVQTMQAEKRAHIQRRPSERHRWFENGLHESVGYKSSGREEGDEKIVSSVSGFLSHSVLHWFLHIYYTTSSYILTSAFLLAVRHNNDK